LWTKSGPNPTFQVRSFLIILTICCFSRWIHGRRRGKPLRARLGRQAGLRALEKEGNFFLNCKFVQNSSFHLLIAFSGQILLSQLQMRGPAAGPVNCGGHRWTYSGNLIQPLKYWN
jgi:hypothetical protein